MLSIHKSALKWTGFDARSNHIGHLIGVAELVDAGGLTLPGVTLQIELKEHLTAVRCLYLFSIMKLEKGQRKRLYQLEVSPKTKRTHNGKDAAIYGPHEHNGEDVIAVDDVSCDNFPKAVAWFFKRTNIAPFPIDNPLKDVEL